MYNELDYDQERTQDSGSNKDNAASLLFTECYPTRNHEERSVKLPQSSTNVDLENRDTSTNSKTKERDASFVNKEDSTAAMMKVLEKTSPRAHNALEAKDMAKESKRETLQQMVERFLKNGIENGLKSGNIGETQKALAQLAEANPETQKRVLEQLKKEMESQYPGLRVGYEIGKDENGKSVIRLNAEKSDRRTSTSLTIPSEGSAHGSQSHLDFEQHRPVYVTSGLAADKAIGKIFSTPTQLRPIDLLK